MKEVISPGYAGTSAGYRRQTNGYPHIDRPVGEETVPPLPYRGRPHGHGVQPARTPFLFQHPVGGLEMSRLGEGVQDPGRASEPSGDAELVLGGEAIQSLSRGGEVYLVQQAKLVGEAVSGLGVARQSAGGREVLVLEGGADSVMLLLVSLRFCVQAQDLSYFKGRVDDADEEGVGDQIRVRETGPRVIRGCFRIEPTLRSARMTRDRSERDEPVRKLEPVSGTEPQSILPPGDPLVQPGGYALPHLAQSAL